MVSCKFYKDTKILLTGLKKSPIDMKFEYVKRHTLNFENSHCIIAHSFSTGKHKINWMYYLLKFSDID